MAVVEITFWYVLNRFMKTSQLVSSHLNQQRWGVLYHKIFTLNLTFCCCSILGSYLLSLGSCTEGESISVKSQPRYQANNGTKTSDQQIKDQRSVPQRPMINSEDWCCPVISGFDLFLGLPADWWKMVLVEILYMHLWHMGSPAYTFVLK